MTEFTEAEEPAQEEEEAAVPDDVEAEVAGVLREIEAHSGTVAARDFDGRTAFELARTLPGVDVRVLTSLLFLSLPVDTATGAAVPAESHDHAWHRAVQQDRNASAVGAVLDAHPMLAEALGSSEDQEGRQVCSSCCPRDCFHFDCFH